MSEEIDAVLFDAGGTLFDLKPTKEEVLHSLLKKRGFEVPLEKVTRLLAKAERRFDEKAAALDGINEGAFWKEYDKFVLEQLQYKGDFKEFSDKLSAEFEKMIPQVNSWAEYPDARPLLDDLKDRKFRLGVVSNATDLVRRVLDNLDLTKYFETIVVSAEVGVRKPHERIFKIAADRVRSPPNRVIYIGDRFAIDVLGAKRAGMNAILLDRFGAYTDLRVLRVKSLSALRRYL